MKSKTATTFSPRTDMALELLKNKRAAGCKTSVKTGQYGLKRTDVEISDEQTAKDIGKPVGSYRTLEIGRLWKKPAKVREYAANEIAEALTEALHSAGEDRRQTSDVGRQNIGQDSVIARSLSDEAIQGKKASPSLGSVLRFARNDGDVLANEKEKTKQKRKAPINNILVACLGNRNMAADALGPYTMDKLLVTRHMADKGPMKSMCAISPGVLGVTGIETYDVLKALADRIKPDAVIAVDTLASSSAGRLASAFQIADSGITPGSGVGNRRFRLDFGTLGVPVVAVGVPLVMYASTIVNEVMGEVFQLSTLNSQLKKAERVAYDMLGDMIVTLKDIDVVVKECAGILATAINMAVHGISVREANELIN